MEYLYFLQQTKPVFCLTLNFITMQSFNSIKNEKFTLDEFDGLVDFLVANFLPIYFNR